MNPLGLPSKSLQVHVDIHLRLPPSSPLELNGLKTRLPYFSHDIEASGSNISFASVRLHAEGGAVRVHVRQPPLYLTLVPALGTAHVLTRAQRACMPVFICEPSTRANEECTYPRNSQRSLRTHLDDRRCSEPSAGCFEIIICMDR